MPKNLKWVVKDTVTGLYLMLYNEDPHFCQWANADDAILFDTEADTAPVIATLGQAGRFIGTNPPLH
jgi:hypothetical protein